MFNGTKSEHLSFMILCPSCDEELWVPKFGPIPFLCLNPRCELYWMKLAGFEVDDGRKKVYVREEDILKNEIK
jgi:hypothetical protein